LSSAVGKPAILNTCAGVASPFPDVEEAAASGLGVGPLWGALAAERAREQRQRALPAAAEARAL